MSVVTDLFQLFVGRHGDMIAPTNELILAFSMVGGLQVWSQHNLQGFTPTVWSQVEPSLSEVLRQYGETTRLCEGTPAVAGLPGVLSGPNPTMHTYCTASILECTLPTHLLCWL